MENESVPQKEEKEHKNSRKKIIFLLVAIVAVLVTFFLLLLLLPSKKEDPKKVAGFYFYPVTQDNIFENEEYLGLNRSICYQPDPAGYGLREEITEEDLETFDRRVQFLVTFLNTVTAGDTLTYRSYFSNSYLKDNTIPEFTQQMLYNMEIRFISESVGKDGTPQSVYRLDYMIHRNNGTYRQDVDSDSVRPQFVVLKQKADGTYQIENLYVRSTIQK